MDVYFPTTIAPQVGSGLVHTLEAVSTDNASPVGITRLKFNKKSLGFSLKYENITKDMFDTLKAFFEQNQGTRFKYTYTDTTGSTTYWCMFAMDELIVTYGRGTLRSTTIKLVTT